MIWYESLFWIIIVIIVHELGHYIAFRAYGFKPSFRFWTNSIREITSSP